jgi:hypothetical protein
LATSLWVETDEVCDYRWVAKHAQDGRNAAVREMSDPRDVIDRQLS